MDSRTRIVSAGWMASTIALSTIIVSGIVYSGEKLWDYIWSGLDQPNVFPFVMALFLFLLFGISYLLVPRVNRITRATAHTRSDAEITPPEYLITGYSPLMKRDAAEDRMIALTVEEAMEKVDALACQYPDLDRVCEEPKLDVRTCPVSWQQNLRVIRAAHRKGALKQVLVVEPDCDQFDAFKACIQKYCDAEVKYIRAKGSKDARFTAMFGGVDGQDYENFDYVTAAIGRAFEMIAEHAGEKVDDLEDRVAFDVTPGLKIYSIAAAIQSLNRNAIFYYAKTRTGEHGKVIAYDASIGFSGSPM